MFTWHIKAVFYPEIPHLVIVWPSRTRFLVMHVTYTCPLFSNRAGSNQAHRQYAARPIDLQPYKHQSSQQPLPRQLNLLHRLPFLVPAFTSTDRDALAQLDFVFDVFPRAWAVVWEVDAGEGAGTEVFIAVGCSEALARYLFRGFHEERRLG
jgi:hypothetical protein